MKAILYSFDGDSLCRECAQDVTAGGGRPRPSEVTPGVFACAYCHESIGEKFQPKAESGSVASQSDAPKGAA